MEEFRLNISASLDVLCKRNSTCATELQAFLAKQIWSSSDRAALLDTLSVLFLKPECSQDVAQAFRALMLEILHRCRSRCVEEQKEQDWYKHQWFCIALSKIVSISAEASRFSVEYFFSTGAFYKTDPSCDEPKPKKAKKQRSNAPSTLELIRAVYRLVQALGSDLHHVWDWSDLLKFLTIENLDSRWFALESIVLLAGMSGAQTEAFRLKLFSREGLNTLTVRWNDDVVEAKQIALLLTNPTEVQDTAEGQRTHTMRGILDTDLLDSVVSVCGVLLPKLTTAPGKIEEHLLVDVASTHRNLRSLALAVAAGKPVLLEGPVGSGKTALVEHLAHVTGRTKTPYLIKVQLGDQTDSKALLGTYRCTEIPGEFVWQPGSLTKAVTEGHWVLMEDLDYAPMDVISMLMPLIQSSSLSIPGHGDVIKAAAGFRLFVTQRLLSSGTMLYRRQSAGSMVLEGLWTKISVEPMSRSELEEVIVNRHPQLATVVTKLLDVYFLLSAGRHELSSPYEESELDSDIGKFLTHDGRLISTRDLMKWCSRIAMDFDVSQSSTASMVFQEALDCFCACLAKPDHRLPLAEAIGARFNITKEKADYYCSRYKGDLNVTMQTFSVGRVSLPRLAEDVARVERQRSKFAFTRQAVSLLERVGVCVVKNEPVLLVGETGTGKTSSVQYLAQQLGHPLRVINMNQQSDSTDLLGGFKPIDVKFIVAPFRVSFEELFCQTFSRKQNVKFLGHIQECLSKKKWDDLLKLIEHTCKNGLNKFERGTVMFKKWEDIGYQLHKLKTQVKQAQCALAFSFAEGSLVKALKSGQWVLLDEINLASAETLECLSGLLESTAGSVVLMERGDTEPIVRHKDFRLFACMNPATDVGKKDLPPGVRNRFTELYVDELEDVADLKILVAEYLRGLSLTAVQVEGIVTFYITVRKEAAKKLTDCTGRRPHYSLRTLCRALSQAALNCYGSVARSLYESFCLSFLTQLDRSSHPLVEQMVTQHIIGKSCVKAVLKQALPKPTTGDYLQFEGYWVAAGTKKPEVPDNYVMTPSVRANLRDLVRIVSAGRFPVLLQGETSVGKTSLIHWLAASSGNVCLRINNHEHTDLQEYVGCYAADETGKLVFKEGVLVEAMRKGYWIILDELNLAPTDVLEALNRLLDDNRELFIPETQEVVKAHPKFMLFATQNPPGQYGGRKVLSRAFRNRFVELHFDNIPSRELETILHQRCSLPLSYCKKLVAIMLELQTRRRSSGVFAGKQGYITLRDLFRWAERYHRASQDTNQKYFDWDQQLADNGYMLLAGKVRKEEECLVIQEVLEKHTKRKVNPDNLFTSSQYTSPTTRGILEMISGPLPSEFGHVVWTYTMRRMAVLVGQALKFGEPVLLVGETGCGKTTVCQLHAAVHGNKLYSVNCHLHTEGADFLGGLRPFRHKEEASAETQKLFEWCDGPLVHAMKDGAMFLIDEISLADDSVLERLNSVLEPERTLLLAEKGGGDWGQNEVEQITAAEEFRVCATMNPGGDYGKKELSPALRNRFTEIWCPQSSEPADLVAIIEHNLKPGIHLCNREDGNSGIGAAILDFVNWFSNNDLGKRSTVSIRDLLSWVQFINVTASTLQEDGGMDVDGPPSSHLDPAVAYIHGACLIFLDALGSGVTGGRGTSVPVSAQDICMQYLVKQVQDMTGQQYDAGLLGLHSPAEFLAAGVKMVVQETGSFGIPPFYIASGPQVDTALTQYTLSAPTTSINARRILRGLQLPRPILLEGSPGVGKTSLVSAIAKAAGHELVRINLSEQTDITDLFGADLPVEGGEGGRFAWRDGPLLRALKAGHWVVLDELNLASQSVLEGLNACLDHRAEVYVPELDMTFQVQHEKTRIFACQNPLNQGGGRKGLPKSFLNRFTQVYVDPLSRTDLLFITESMYRQLPADLIAKMVDFNTKICQEVLVEGAWGQKGSPWEFNLRDIFRWADLLTHNQAPKLWNAGEYVGLVYSDRMRTAMDKDRVYKVFEDVFKPDMLPYKYRGQVKMTTDTLQVGHSFMMRRSTLPLDRAKTDSSLSLLHHCLPPLEAVMKCLQMNWMAILVGPPSSGKTSLVHLLAQLTGHRLHVLPMNSAMDTTELLGGFEQADLNRHLEQLTRRVKILVQDVVIQFLASTRDNPALSQPQKLLSDWYQYEQLFQQVVETSSGAEVGQMRKKLLSLEDILNDLLTINNRLGFSFQGAISSYVNNLSGLKTQLEADQATNQGGCFEWVDSLLVQALKEGTWLLIDNVNFCSPSVLDRLNALLEPGGVLSISERGIIDGEIPTITPHPDFRLILAMDPQYGEISRAMRNRGVEIYILGEKEDGHYSEQDLLVMMSGLGLVGHVPCQTLLSVHSSVHQSLPPGDQCCLLDLLQATSLTVQQLQRGAHILTALTNSCMDVYVRKQRSHAIKQKLGEVVSGQLADLDLMKWESDHRVSSLVQPALWPLARPQVHLWSGNVSMATVQQDSLLLVHLVDLINLQMDTRSQVPLTYNELCNSPKPEIKLPEDAVNMLQPAIQILMEHCSLANWQLLSHWLEQRLSCSRMSDVEPLSHNKNWLRDSLVKNLSKLVSLALKTIFTHPMISVVEEQWEKLTSSQDGLSCLKQQSIDLRWNPGFMHRLQVQMTIDQQSCAAQHLQALHSISNQLQLSGYLAQKMFLYLSGLESSAGLKKNQVTSLLKLSYAFHNGEVEMGQLPHPGVAHLYPFLQVLAVSIEQMLKKQLIITNDQLHECLVNWLWLERFVQICRQPIEHRKTPANDSLPILALHWDWLQRNLLTLLFSEDSMPAELQSITSSLQNCIGIDNEASRKHRALWDSMGHPRAFYTPEVAIRVSKLGQVCDQLNLHTVAHSGDQLRKRVRCWLEKGQDLSVSIMDCFTRMWTVPGIEPHEDIMMKVTTRIDELLGNFDLESSQLPAMEVGDNPVPQESTDVALWPLYDCLALKVEHHLLACLIKDVDDINLDEIQQMVQFNASRLPTRPLDMVWWKLLYTEEEQMKQILISDLLVGFMSRAWDGVSTRLCNTFLHWTPQVNEDGTEESPEEGRPVDETLGPSTFYFSQVNHIAFSLLYKTSCSRSQKVTKSQREDWLLNQIELGQYQEKLGQLKDLSQTLWSHVGHMSMSQVRMRVQDARLLMASLVRLMQSVIAVPNDHPYPSDTLEQLIAALPHAADTLWDNAKISCANSPLNELLPDFTPIMSRTMELVQEVSHSILGGESKHDVCQESCGPSVEGGNFPSLKQVLLIGQGWAHLGLVQTFLLAPQGPVDPADEKALQYEYMKRELELVQEELHVRNWHSELLTGQSIDINDPNLHSYLHWLKGRGLTLHTANRIGQDVPHRPQPSQFPLLLQEVKQFKSSIISVTNVQQLLTKLENAASSMISPATFMSRPDPALTATVKEAKAWQSTVLQVVKRMRTSFPLYRDLLMPFLSGVCQLVYGVHLMTFAVDAMSCHLHLLPRQLLSSQPAVLDSLMTSLCQFPTVSSIQPSLLTLAQSLLSDHCFGLLTHLQDKLEEQSEDLKTKPMKFLPMVMKGALLHLRNHALLVEELEGESAFLLSQLFHHYVAMWRSAETERKQREEEQASLYRYKTTMHGDTLTEAEHDKLEIRKAFPSFEQEFEDISVGYTLDDKPNDEPKPSEEPEDMAWEMSAREMDDVASVHCIVFRTLTHSHWLMPQSKVEVCGSDQVEAVMNTYQVAATLGKQMTKLLGDDLEPHLIGSHLLVSQTLQNSVKDMSILQANQRPYDVYHDPNVPEAVQCRPLLEKLQCRVEELLMEWSDHPTLKQLIVIIDRVMGFPVTAPLMRFVNGLEILLAKSQEWESNAARHVSLADHLESITQLIIQYRKLELSCWSSCLDTAEWKVHQGTSRWWFHIYQLLESYLNPPASTEQQEDTDPTSLVAPLQQFIEGSTLGEFNTRLDLLLAFHCQLIHMDQSQHRDILLAIFWNTHQYYSQFKCVVKDKIAKLREPIQKELKGFVKIARWNDINFHALKQAVKKTHETIHKHTKEFQKVLNQPVQPVFTDSRCDWQGSAPEPQVEACHQAIDVQKFETPDSLKCDIESLPPGTASPDSPLLRLSSLFSKMRKHCHHLLRNLPYENLVTAVNIFTGDVIANVHELQSFKVTEGVDKDKAKSEAKHINLRKRKALSDFFKYLQTIGLSYRKGLVALQDLDSLQDMTTQPFDISTALGQLNSKQCDEETTKTWSDCMKYHTRCIARRALFHTAIQSPSQELGVGNIDRCRGFSEDLMNIVRKQWTNLSKTTQELIKLRQRSEAVRHLAEASTMENSSPGLPPQSQVRRWRAELKNLSNQTTLCLQQFELLMQCCPEQQTDGASCTSPIPSSIMAKISNVSKQSQVWKEIIEEIKNLQFNVQAVKNGTAPGSQSKSDIETWQDVENLKNGFDAMSQVSIPIGQMESTFLHPQTGEGSCLSSSLRCVKNNINATTLEFQTWLCDLKGTQNLNTEPKVTEEMRAFGVSVDKLVTQILLVVQTFVKDQIKGKEQLGGLAEKGEDVIYEELEDHHLTEKLVKPLSSNLKTLNLRKISRTMDMLLSRLRQWSENANTDENNTVLGSQLLAQCLPLVDQYSHLVQYFLTLNVAFHRASAKLLSVTLGIFAELAMKGFCLPAEFSDEAGGEGATEFQDIEGGGLGEGEGVKDVSDQIESEDQLEEARKKDEETEENQGDQPEVSAEDNAIEMHDDFDAKAQDMDPTGDQESDSENDKDEEDLDKQIGDLEGADADRLDDQVWGSDEEEEEEKDTKEEDGPGAGAQSEAEVVAKDDNPDKRENDKSEKQSEQQDKETGEDQKPHELDQLDENEFSEDQMDPHQGNEPPPLPEDSAVDLPDDLNLDKEDDEEGTEEENMTEANPLDLDKDTEDLKGQDLDEEEKLQEEDQPNDTDMKEETKEKDEEMDQQEEGVEDKEESPQNEEEVMDTSEPEKGEPDNQPGLQPQTEDDEDQQVKNENDKPDEVAQAAEHAGKTEHSTQDVQQVDNAPDAAGKTENDQDEADGSGVAESDQQQGHEGDKSTAVVQRGNSGMENKLPPRKPGKSRTDRSLGTVDEKTHNRLKTIDSSQSDSQEQAESEHNPESDLYEHVKDAQSHHDTQTMDTATDEQMEEQAVPNIDDHNDKEADDVEADEDMKPDDSRDQQEAADMEKLSSAKLKKAGKKEGEDEEKQGQIEDIPGDQKMETDGEKVVTSTVPRGPQSSFHTAMQHLNFTPGELDIEHLRASLEEGLSSWVQPQPGSAQEASAAMEAWHQYEALTSSLAQELCEQLRLVLEPSQASKLRGDYRTGKRLNMRKVIPYIASQFRKDKIWLRRTKPSKRQYQVMVAVDDSSSMADNHSKQLAFESVAVIANALTLLEVGELSISSFGESVQLLHPFHEQFTNQSGARILQQFTFDQKKTKIAQLLDQVTGMMVKARSRQHGSVTQVETSQLLLIVSDGRGLFLEGMEVVKSAVRKAREANVFLVFVIIDNPDNKDSILDIRVPVFKGPGQLPEITSYMDHFPFPFYIILRDINSLPHTLSDALRQWFELVTAMDKG